MKKEGAPKKEDAVDFLERQRQKSNALKREKLGESSDGYALYPEEKIEITAQHALELARSIIRIHTLDSEDERIKKGEINFGIDRDELASHRGYWRLSSNESLLKALSLHEKSPNHYKKEVILAAAEELVCRLSPK